MQRRFMYISFIVLQSIIYGIGNPITKIAYESITPFYCMAFRFVLATLIFMLVAGKKSIAELKTVRMREWMPGALFMAGAYISCNIALDMTSAMMVGFLMSLQVVFVPVLAIFVLHRPYRKTFFLIQLAAVAGLYLLCCNGGTFSFGLGEAMALMVSVCVAGALVWGEKSLKSLSPITVSLTQVAVTALISTAGALIFERGTHLAAIQPAAWWVIIYLAILCSCVAYLFQNAALLHISSGLVALAQCTEPIFTAVAAYFILNEHLSGIAWMGAGLLLVCIICGSFLEKQNPEIADEECEIC